MGRCCGGSSGDGGTGPAGPAGPAGTDGADGADGADAVAFFDAGPEITVTGTGTEIDPWVIGRKKAGAFVIVVDDPDVAITTGDGQAFLLVPAYLNGTNVSAVHAALPGGADTSAITVMLTRVRAATPVNVLSTAVTIDATETSSFTAATPPMIDAANDDLLTGDLLRVDVDADGDGVGLGLQVVVQYLEP